MTTIIKGGTVVTADLSYRSDVRIDEGQIVEIGPDLEDGDVLDASGCYVMPGGVDPHTHLEMPFMGTYSADDFESGTRAALSGGTTMVASNSGSAASSSRAVARRRSRSSSLSVPRPTSRRTSSSHDGGARKQKKASGIRSRTWRAPWRSISSSAGRPDATISSTGARGVP